MSDNKKSKKTAPVCLLTHGPCCHSRFSVCLSFPLPSRHLYEVACLSGAYSHKDVSEMRSAHLTSGSSGAQFQVEINGTALFIKQPHFTSENDMNSFSHRENWSSESLFNSLKVPYPRSQWSLWSPSLFHSPPISKEQKWAKQIFKLVLPTPNVFGIICW